jgi:hypothetical protein
VKAVESIMVASNVTAHSEPPSGTAPSLRANRLPMFMTHIVPVGRWRKQNAASRANTQFRSLNPCSKHKPSQALVFQVIMLSIFYTPG